MADQGFFDEDHNDMGDERFDDFLTNKVATVYLIDATAQMFVPYHGNDSILNTPFAEALKCVRFAMRETIMASDADQQAVVFFGTEKQNNALGEEGRHLFIFQELEAPSKERIKELLDLEEEANLKELKDGLGHSNAYSLASALWLCQEFLAKGKTKQLAKRVFVFTCNDEPHANSEQMRMAALSRATQLRGTGIDILPMPLEPQSGCFSGQKFYALIENHNLDNNFSVDLDADDRFDSEAKGRFEELKKRVLAKDHKKRPFARLTLSLGDDKAASLSVGMFTLVRKVNKPSPVYVTKNFAQPVKSVQTLYRESQATAAVAASDADGDGDEDPQQQQQFVQVMPQDVVNYVEFGGKRAILDQHEVSDLKDFGPSGLHMLGFKPLRTLKLHTIFNHHGNFLYPDDDIIQGSTKLFSALLDRCLAREVYMLCRLVSKKHTPPRLVALVPMAEKRNARGEQMVPPGFNVAYLPFADDIRSVPALLRENASSSRPVEVPRVAIESAKKVITAMMDEEFQLRYSPALQTHWTMVEASALNLTVSEQVTDDSLPRQKLVEKAKAAADEFNRIAPPDLDGGGAKRGSDAAMMGDVSREVSDAAKKGRLNSLTVAVLKVYLQSVGVVVSGSTRKPDLVDAVERHLQNTSTKAAPPPKPSKRLKVEDDEDDY